MMAAVLPVGIIFCPERSESLARYALEGLANPMLVREYCTLLPDEQSRRAGNELTRTRCLHEARRTIALPRRKK